NDILENSLKMYDYESAKMILARDNLLYQELAIHIALQLFQRTGDKAYAEQAYHFSETTKAMILQESINNITAWDLLDFPPHIREEEERLRRELATYEASLAEYRDFADDSTISNWERRVFAAKQAYQDLIKNIERDFPEYYELKYEPASPTLNEIGAYLKKEKAIMIEYFWGEKFLHIFALDGQEIYTHSILLDSTHLEKDLSDFIYYLGDPSNKLQGRDLSVFNQFVSDSRSLYQQLLEPMLKQMRENSNEKLVFIPGGMLGYLPFEILLTNDPTKPGADYGSLDYLLRKYRIKYDYSAKLFMNYSDLKHARNFTYGGFAPSYGKDFEIGNWKLGGLFYNQKEVEQASQIMEGDSFLDSLATKDHFLSRLGKYDILHFAMHALMDDQQPGNSGLAFYHPKNNDNIFSGNQRSIEIDSAFVNSFLYVFEIYKLRIQADLVVLSACNTGVGQLVKGEGIMSLARAFAYAGCPGLVMSLWQVDDAQTQVLMESFFANLKQGMDKDEALRQAKLSFLDSEDANHPFFWASFVQTGSSAPFQTGNNWLLYSLFVGLFILVMGGIRILIKK
ncbi:MAG: CHAT domain-containing protein, partial [Bacteroidetes bacterium]|nr:CHAT domain-containing protein [Bacteroidota bacterium]